MEEEDVGISKSSVASMFWSASLGLTIVEDDNFVDAEDCTCSRYLADQAGFLIMGESTAEKILTHKANMLESTRRTYFAMMLPGSARLRVKVLPPVGWKTADGLDVSGPRLKSSSTFRFYRNVSEVIRERSYRVPLTCDWACWANMATQCCFSGDEESVASGEALFPLAGAKSASTFDGHDSDLTLKI